jgi:hypothetical protein
MSAEDLAYLIDGRGKSEFVSEIRLLEFTATQTLSLSISSSSGPTTKPETSTLIKRYLSTTRIKLPGSVRRTTSTIMLRRRDLLVLLQDDRIKLIGHEEFSAVITVLFFLPENLRRRHFLFWLCTTPGVLTTIHISRHRSLSYVFQSHLCRRRR